MKKNHNRLFFWLFSVSLFFILLNYGIHLYRTFKFNQKIRTIHSYEKIDDCNFSIHFRGGASDSWLKRDMQFDNKTETLKGSIFDGVFYNNSIYEIRDWKLKININEDCWLNNSWCGTVEIHQGDKVQTIDLRNFKKEDVFINGFSLGQDYMIPLSKGDFVIYHPSVSDRETVVHAFNGNAGSMTIGFIFYTDELKDFNVSDFQVDFKLHKGYLQGTEPVIFVVLISLWLLALIIRITAIVVYRRAEVEAERARQETEHVKKMQEKIVLGIATIVDNGSRETNGHVKRTSDIIKIVANQFRRIHPDLLSEENVGDIVRAAPLHDFGKIYIPESVLYKPGKLTDEEYERIKQHPVDSGMVVDKVLRGVEEPHFVDIAYNVARHHHERWDGRGYPDHLAGEAIPLEARIMAIADVYDALVSKRCYKEPMSFEKAYEVMCEGMGSQFDPQMKEVFIACHGGLEDYYKSLKYDS